MTRTHLWWTLRNSTHLPIEGRLTGQARDRRPCSMRHYRHERHITVFSDTPERTSLCNLLAQYRLNRTK